MSCKGWVCNAAWCAENIAKIVDALSWMCTLKISLKLLMQRVKDTITARLLFTDML